MSKIPFGFFFIIHPLKINLNDFWNNDFEFLCVYQCQWSSTFPCRDTSLKDIVQFILSTSHLTLLLMFGKNNYSPLHKKVHPPKRKHVSRKHVSRKYASRKHASSANKSTANKYWNRILVRALARQWEFHEKREKWKIEKFCCPGFERETGWSQVRLLIHMLYDSVCFVTGKTL